MKRTGRQKQGRQHFNSFVSQWCPPFFTGHVAFLFICLPGLSLSIHLSPRSVTAGVHPFPLAMQHFFSLSIHLSPRSVTAGVRPFPLAMQRFYSFVSQVCHCWCPPFSAGHAAFLFICLPVSALFHWPCSISVHLSPRSVTTNVRPFPLATQHFYSFVSQVCHCWCPPFSAGHAVFLFICLPGLSLLVPALLPKGGHIIRKN